MSSKDVAQKRPVPIDNILLNDDKPIQRKKRSKSSTNTQENLAHVLREQAAQRAQEAHAVQSAQKTTESAPSTTNTIDTLANMLRVQAAQPAQEAHAVQSAQSTTKSAQSTTKSAQSTTKSAQSTTKSAQSTTTSAQSTTNSPLSLAHLLKQQAGGDKYEVKVDTSTNSSDDDEPLSSKLPALTWEKMVQDNLEIEAAKLRDKTIDGMERPVEPEAWSEEQVKKADHRRNAAYKRSLSGGQPVEQVMKKAEKNKRHRKKTDSRNDLQEVSTSSSDDKSFDDDEYGELSDDLELMRNDAPKSIHAGPSLPKRDVKSTVKYNPRRGGADTLHKNEILAGLRVKISFKKLVRTGGGHVEGYVSWNRDDYRKAQRNKNSRNYQDGSRHPDLPLFVGWSLHDSPAFHEKFHSLLVEKDGPPIGPENAFALLKSNMDGNGNKLFGKTVVIYMDANKNMIPDRFLQVEIMEEFEEEVQKEDKEGQKKKKKNRHNKSAYSSDGDFSPGALTDSDSEEFSIYSDNGSVVKCDNRSDVSDSDNGSVESCDNRSDVSENSKDDKGVEEEDKDGEKKTNEGMIGEGEMLGFQQDALESDSDEVSDDESQADKSGSGDSDDDDKSA